MSKHYERALVLYSQSRYDLAEREFRQALGEEPDHAIAHSFLAICLSEQKQLADATEEAKRGVALAPDSSFTHYSLARVFCDRNRYKEAEQAIREALHLDPLDANYFGLLAAIHHDCKRWQESLNAAEEGLAIDAEHVGCTNLRALALVKLGRREEAGATIDAALARDPENAFTHANQGWVLLHEGKPKPAMEHFREALRLEPQFDWAQAGIVEALKAHNPIYALMLRYFLWMGRLSGKAQWGVILGGYLGFRILDSVAAKNPGLRPLILPIIILYVVFAAMTWIAYPLFNLLLRLNRFGRLTLSREQTLESNIIGGCLLGALISLGTSLVFAVRDLQAVSLTARGFLCLGLVLAFMVLPISASFRCPDGWPTWVMRAGAGVIGAIGLYSVSLGFVGSKETFEVFGTFVTGVFISLIATNVLSMVRVKR